MKQIQITPQNHAQAMGWLQGQVSKCAEAGVTLNLEMWTGEKRSTDQNAKIHAMFSDLREQAVITIPGNRIVLKEYEPEALKALLVVWFWREKALMGEQSPRMPRTVTDPMTGERVTVRPSTTQYTKKEMTEFVEWLYALGSQCRVSWSEPAIKAYEEYCR